MALFPPIRLLATAAAALGALTALPAAAQTVLGLAGAVLIPVDDSGTDYRILVRSSFARYLAAWLVDAAQEYAVAW